MPPASADHLLSSFFLIWSTAPSTLQPRHLRAIQSILHWHPAAQVTVLSNTLPTDFFLLWSSAEREARVKVERYDLEELCADSPLADWYSRRDEWNRSTFFSNHESDLLRLMFLFRRGGVYVDADVVFVRPLRLPSGCEHGIVGLESGTGGVAAEDGWSPSITSDSSAGLPPIVCNAVMAFRAGHPLLAAMLSAFAHEYVPYTPGCTMLELFAKGEWGAMGPLLLSRLLLKRQPPSPPLRATSSAEEGTDDEEEEEELASSWHPTGYAHPATCVLERTALYPLAPGETSTFFGVWDQAKWDMIHSRACTVHFWNGLTRDVELTCGSLMHRLLEEHAGCRESSRHAPPPPPWCRSVALECTRVRVR